MTDMRTTCSEKQRELKELFKKKILSPDEKEIIGTAMEFSYASAYCARTCDMNQRFYAAGNYEDDYKKMLEEMG